jgi:NADPH:quinone reductase-like Zn-dependent oxidoreductase
MDDTRTMYAAIAEAPAQPLRRRSVPRPAPGAGEVLVRTIASGVNPLDTKIHAGAAAHARQPLPAILGIELAGIVGSVGPGVTQFRAGDEVIGMVGGVGGHPGTLAEFVAADARLLAHKPSKLTMREAACLPLSFITAFEGLVDRADVRAGQTVLVHGAAGGVGRMAVQLARSRGAVVVGTDSASKRELVEESGATFVDYRAESVDDYVARCTRARGFDVVYDTVGGATLDASFQAVRRFGRVVSALGWGTHALAPLSFRAGTYSGVFTLLPLITGEGREHHGEILAEATRLAEAGQLRPLLDAQRYTLDDVTDAYARLSSGAVVGRLVVDVG